MTNSYTIDRENVISGNTTFESIVQKNIGNINANSSMNAFLLLNDNAIQSSKETDKRACSLSSIDGMNIAIKDNISTKGIRTTCASKMLQDFIPVYDATVISRLKQKGAIILGKANMDEFAMGSSGETSYFGATDHPLFAGYVPGGSSSGSAVAVAAGLVPAALGTDTGGSIRQPASMCGIVGWKPSYGRNSRYGVIAMASSLDTPGYFARTVRDAGMLYEATAGYDPLDATSLDAPVKIDESIWQKKDLSGIKVGIPKEYFIDGIDPGVRGEINESIEKLRELGAEIVDISLPHTEHGISVYYVICPAEVASNMARYDGIRYGAIAPGAHDIAANREA